MATRKRRTSTRRRPKAPRTPETPPSPPPLPAKREPSKIEQKILAAGERVLDLLAEDPERFFRMGEGVVTGVAGAVRYAQEHPDEARRTVRNTVISVAAKMAKKKLRGE